ncbi:agmatine/peptidylarginine deiminase [Kitasatospora sp. A2-31]|uniref:agmatine deiminase family protein n=1 Tax=Kitasatospora sp. A2-31 TaxID=2916414 RepID=UPI001EEA89C2|nr:agmatine deiminase family protein [Kitasatospora sp. A2-31]MCG6497994.1 agmatine deiminase family protein [Kitasatospora sp. A2-31]
MTSPSSFSAARATPSRRTVLRAAAGAGLLTLGAAACAPSDGADEGLPSGPASPSAPGASGPAPGGTGAPPGRRFGAEWESHARTFMSWPASTGIWGDQLPEVRGDIARLARAVGAYEPVVMFARPAQVDAAQNACGKDVEVVPLPVDDLWARDTVPVFVEDGGTLKGVDLNFNGWGNKQKEHGNDSALAAAVLGKYEVERVRTSLVAEGGSLETDGEGTLMVTESSVVNQRRNPGRSRDEIEAELRKALGVTKVIWFAGVRDQDITDAHVDCLVRFAAPGVVLLDQPFPGAPADVWSRSAAQAREVLKNATDAHGRPLKVIDLPQPDPSRITGRGDAFVSSYINFYVANKALFLPRFGDARADDQAQQILRDHFPGRDIVPVVIDGIASGGGGIHCSTHDQPGTPAS